MTTFIEDSLLYLPLLLQGAWVSIQVLFLSLAIATVLGMALALMRLSNSRL
jgi:ABC-type amino acid transport system permease subunit